ncbi:hypothetical protein C8J57DRAFT_1317979 [Mycena rebaudengoi]|nr:hypothetical protein C8J57DRAFT_1317979 [Mycena rebaudengoi]
MPPFFGPVNIGQTTSPILFGGLIVFMLFGALSVQLYVYSLCFPQDRRGVKTLVYGIYLTMLVCLCLDTADMHFWFGAGFGDLDKFQRARFSGVNGPIVGSLVGLCVQLFFAYRISMFRQAVWFSGVVAVISITQAAGGIGAGTTLYLADSGRVELLARNVFFIHMWLIGSAVADILIAGAMTYLLLNTAEPGTHHIVKRVVRLIVETNSLTASVAIVGAFLFAFSKSTYFLCPTSILPEIYANTLLLVLNNRATPNRTAPQRAPPSSNNISSVSDGTTAHTQTAGLPRSLYGYGAPEDVPMKTMSPPLGSNRRTSIEKRPSMSLDNTPIPRGMSLSPPRSEMSLPFQTTNANNQPTVDLDRHDFGDRPYVSSWE